MQHILTNLMLIGLTIQRNEAMARAYLSGAYTMAEIGGHFKVHYMTVSRAVKRYEKQ
jgi:DNA-binding MarR family transcriptional regulator